LVHKLHSIGKQDSLSGLYFITMENLAPRVTSLPGFEPNGFQNIALFFDNFGVVGIAGVDIA
jgi:hypothetical protein